MRYLDVNWILHDYSVHMGFRHKLSCRVSLPLLINIILDKDAFNNLIRKKLATGVSVN